MSHFLALFLLVAAVTLSGCCAAAPTPSDATGSER